MFAALIVPWFVNWNDYKTTFEIDAEKILGHPVHVAGTARATILPSPSLTFTDVEVADAVGQPLMTVDRFSVTIELMPLLQGEIRIISMTLGHPVVHISVDSHGNTDWFARSAASRALDPKKVVLERAEIRDGELTYANARTGVALNFAGIAATIEASTLLGPWRIEGSLLDNGERVPFHFATGIRLADGTIRVKSDFSPARWPVAVTADGVLSNTAEAGLRYQGTYNVAQIDTDSADQGNANDSFAGWRSDGSFALSGERLVIDKAVLTNGPPDRPASVAGALTVNFGAKASFSALVKARQLDLDRSLGGGPNQPVEVSSAAQRLVDWLTSLPIPPIPGRLTFNIPAIVVGGSIIQGVNFVAEPAAAGWQIKGFRARLPGQATLDADGVLTTEKQFGFVGTARLAAAQPATFAAWWRGRSQQEAGRLLAAFDLAGKVAVAPGRVAVDDITARIGDATISGRFAWSESPRDHHRHLGTDLKADRIDFVQVKALAELLAGRNLTDAAGLADSYSILLSAGDFAFENVDMRDVNINAGYADDVLTVVQLGIGDLGGASLRVTGGRIDNLTTNPRGHLDAKLEATTLEGVARIVNQFWPNSGLAHWLTAAAPALAPAALSARITAPAEEGGSGFRVALDGAAGSTSFKVVADAGGRPADWQTAPARLSVEFDSPDTAALGRQVGLGGVAIDRDSGAHVEIEGAGIPGKGLDAKITSEVAGLTVNASGKLTFAADFMPTFAGTFAARSDDLAPLIAVAGLGIPGAATGTNVDLAGTVDVAATGATLQWQRGTLAGQVVGGKIKLTRNSDQNWQIGGDLNLDEADLGWLTALGLGFPPMPTGSTATPWSKTPFISPVYGPVEGTLNVSADHLDVGAVDIANTRFDVALAPQRIDVNLTAGQLAGGVVTGGLSIHNVAGNANLLARFDLKGAALDSFVWQLDGRSVATGTLDLSANFEATGRSPAGLVSSATGGGVISISDGEARYVNPAAVRPLIRASDLGQQYSEDALRLSFTEAIDGGVLKFDQASSAFAITAGAVRVKNLNIRSANLTANGNAVIDFNTMALDSDWTLTFNPGDAKVQGTDPRAGVVFRGPIAAPSRSIDVLPLAAYLNMRQEARMLEIIAMEEATRAEKERLTQLVDKIQQDDARRARDARLAAEAEARRHAAAVAAASALENLHEARETVSEARRVSALKLFADKAVAEGNAAQAAAATAAGQAAAAQDAAAAARAALARAIATERQATNDASAAVAALAAARSAGEAAKAKAAAALAAATAADQAVAKADAAQKAASRRADAAASARANADGVLAAAARKAGSAGAAVDAADARAEAAQQAVAAARAASADAVGAVDQARQALTEAQDKLDAASTVADEKNAAEAMATDAVNAATARKHQADAAATAAAADLASAEKARGAAGAAHESAAAAAAQAASAAADAATTAKAAASVASALAVGPGASPDAIAVAKNAEATAQVTADRAVVRKAAADDAAKAEAAARAQLDGAEAARSAAEQKASATAKEAQAAASALKGAVDAARKASAENKTAVAVLAAATAVRDAAANTLQTRQAAADKAAAAIADAEKAAAAANAAAATARTAAGGVLDEKTAAASAAEKAAAEADADAAVLKDATAARTAALADQKSAHAAADAAASAAAAAAKALTERVDANDAAKRALTAATEARKAAEQKEAAAQAAANEAARSAEAASEEAKAKTAAADAAKEAAQRAAEEAGPFGAGTAPISAQPKKAASLPLATQSAAAVATPLPRSAPAAMKAAERPLNIVPAR